MCDECKTSLEVAIRHNLIEGSGDVLTATEIRLREAEFFRSVGVRFPPSAAEAAINELVDRVFARYLDLVTEIEMEDLLP